MSTLTRKQLHAKAHQVLDHLAAKATPGPGVTDPTAWRKTVRNRLRGQHWDTLLETLADDPDADVDELATALAPPPPAPREPAFDPTDGPRRAQEQLMAENAARLAETEQTPLPDPAVARKRVDAIRQALHLHRRPQPEPCTRCGGTGHEPQEDQST